MQPRYRGFERALVASAIAITIAVPQAVPQAVAHAGEQGRELPDCRCLQSPLPYECARGEPRWLSVHVWDCVSLIATR